MVLVLDSTETGVGPYWTILSLNWPLSFCQSSELIVDSSWVAILLDECSHGNCLAAVTTGLFS